MYRSDVFQGAFRSGARTDARGGMALALSASLVLAWALSGCAVPPSKPQAPSGKSGTPASPGAAAQPATAPILMKCGEQTITVRPAGEQLELTMGSRQWLLRQAVSASGARYLDPSQPNTSFWSKGGSGMLMIEGRAYPECVTVSATEPASPLLGREWVVEDIDGRGLIDHSRVTLLFDEQGRVAGRASCNHYTAGYERSGVQLTIKGPATTRMACVPALMDQESRFLALLGQVRHFQVQADGALVLRTADRRRIVAR